MIGMMGAGKTAVGTALARHLKVPFLDSDEEIVKRRRQASIAEIFERDGEAVLSRPRGRGDRPPVCAATALRAVDGRWRLPLGAQPRARSTSRRHLGLASCRS
jgi:hypothetical protein